MKEIDECTFVFATNLPRLLKQRNTSFDSLPCCITTNMWIDFSGVDLKIKEPEKNHKDVLMF